MYLAPPDKVFDSECLEIDIDTHWHDKNLSKQRLRIAVLHFFLLDSAPLCLDTSRVPLLCRCDRSAACLAPVRENSYSAMQQDDRPAHVVKGDMWPEASVSCFA